MYCNGMVFCGVVDPKIPPYLARMHGWWGTKSGYYDIQSDMIYIFLQHPENHTIEGVVDTIIHEALERAIQRVYWDDWLQACHWVHLVIKIGNEIRNEVMVDQRTRI